MRILIVLALVLLSGCAATMSHDFKSVSDDFYRTVIERPVIFVPNKSAPTRQQGEATIVEVFREQGIHAIHGSEFIPLTADMTDLEALPKERIRANEEKTRTLRPDSFLWVYAGIAGDKAAYQVQLTQYRDGESVVLWKGEATVSAVIMSESGLFKGIAKRVIKDLKKNHYLTTK